MGTPLSEPGPGHEVAFGDNRRLWDAWTAGLGEIVTALVEAGLRIERLEEHPELAWGADFLVESAPGSGTFILPSGTSGSLPLAFSLLATRPG